MFLPFRNATRRPEHEWLVTGAPLMLGQVLGQFRDLNVVSDEQLAAARRRVRVPADSVPDATQQRRLAEETGGWTAVTGSVLGTASGVRVSLTATDVPTSNVIVRASVDAPANADLRETFDALSVRLLEPSGVPASGQSLAALTTQSVDAYRAYLRGKDHYNRSNYRSALDAFIEAVRLDSTFALAWGHAAFVSIGARGFGEALDPTTILYRAIDQATRHGSRLPAGQLTNVRVLQAFARANTGEARRIADSVVTADPQNIGAIDLAAFIHGLSIFLSQSMSRDTMARHVNRTVGLVRQLLQIDPSRRVMYSMPAMIYGMAGGLFWGFTWADDRQFTSMPFMMMSVTQQAKATYVPLLRDSIVFVPTDSFRALPAAERARLRRPGADRAMEWVREWLSVGPEDADAHLWASRIADLQGDYPTALREFRIADSLGINSALESVPGRRLSLMVLAGEHVRAGAFADSLLAAGALKQPPFITIVDRRWPYAVAALLLSKRWESAGRLADIVNVTARLTPACESLIRQVTLSDAAPPEHVWREVRDTVAKYADAVRAVPALAPCATTLSTMKD